MAILIYSSNFKFLDFSIFIALIVSKFFKFYFIIFIKFLCFVFS